jgi:hypothetical protein
LPKKIQCEWSTFSSMNSILGTSYSYIKSISDSDIKVIVSP